MQQAELRCFQQSSPATREFEQSVRVPDTPEFWGQELADVVDVKTLNDFAHERVEPVRFDSDAGGVVEYESGGRN
ncbi:hypothetical protein [Candidatus Binatus sp.]|uniref:hypothetical protein n=1 Tax=Candidatus Binatus sp. TaxID=2811406 RepID=UPI003BEDEA1B